MLRASTIRSLAFAGIGTIASIAAVGAQQHVPQRQTDAGGTTKFDVASVKVTKNGPCSLNTGQPGGYVRITGCQLRVLLGTAYKLLPAQNQLTVGVPSSMESERFDIEAKADGNLDRNRRALMLQSLLADRFKLSAHFETKQLRVYVLTVSKAGRTGAKLTPHSEDSKCIEFVPGPAPPNPDGSLPAFCGGFRITLGSEAGSLRQIGDKITMEDFVGLLSGLVGRLVVNQTGLDGEFDTSLDFAPLPGTVSQQGADGTSESAAPSIFTALQEQLGLKLELQTVPVDVLVVDHVEEPSQN